MSVAAAVVGGSLASGLLGASASKKAASAQQAAAETATAEQARQFDLMRSDTAPYRQVGEAAIGRLGSLAGLPGYGSVDPSAILQNVPGYQFRLSEGQKQLDRLQSAGRITGGRAIKEALRYGQDYASGEYGNYLEQLFRLSGIVGNAVNTASAMGQNAASNIGQYRLGAGNAAASGYLGQGSAINNAIQGGLQNYTTYSMYNDLASRFRPAVGYTPVPGTGIGSGGYTYAPD